MKRLALASLSAFAVLACQSDQPASPSSGEVVFAISDGAHGGNARFYFLPPLVPDLVDSGKNGHGSRIRAVLQQAGVTQIDHFVATHYHEDHYGGFDDLTAAPAIPILDGYDRGDKEFLPNSKLTSVTYSDYDTAIGSWADALTRGETIPLDPAMTVTSISAGGVVKRCAGFYGSRPVDGGKPPQPVCERCGYSPLR